MIFAENQFQAKLNLQFEYTFYNKIYYLRIDFSLIFNKSYIT